MKSWNVPLVITSTIKNLVSDFINTKLTLNYKEWLQVLSQCNIADNDKNRSILKSAFEVLNDKSVDYHIMKLEGLLDENEGLSLKEKMTLVYDLPKYKGLKSLYLQDINKQKKLFIEMIQYVSYMQVDDLLIMKYKSEVSFYDLWNEFYMETRGVVIDLDKMTLVSAPYRKFFNYNEKPCTSDEVVKKALKEATDISIKNKEDGSLISVSKYADGLIVATPGSLLSEQAIWAKFFLINHYPIFVKEIPEGKTFLFEGIYPENRVVVDYLGEEKLVLTNIRDLSNGELLTDEEVLDIATQFGFETPIVYKDSLETILTSSKDKVLYPANEKEGWVFKVSTLNETLMFKVKCEDYCEIHNTIRVVNSPKIILAHILDDTFDDFISKVPEHIKSSVQDIAYVLFEHIKTIEIKVSEFINEIPNEFLFSEAELVRNEKLRELLKDSITPMMNDKLSKNIKTTLRDNLLSKAYGKEIFVDKYIQSEFERLWGCIPEELQNQKLYKQKEGRLLGYVYKNIPKDYQSIILEYAKSRKNNYLSLVNLKDIDFSHVVKHDDELDVVA